MDKKTILTHLPLVTERLIIRPFTPDDLDEIQAAKEAQEETLRRWMSWSNDHGLSRAGLDEYYADCQTNDCAIPLMGFDRQTGCFVLATGMDTSDLGYKTIHTGWWLAKGYEGQGLAYEAMQNIFEFMQQIIGAKSVEASYYEGNTRSLNLMDRLGMKPVKTEPKSHTSHLTGELLDVITCERIFE